MAPSKNRVAVVLEMIKFEHSVFALPFALVGALLAARAGNTLPTWRQLLWIVVAMVGARSAAMTMNRIADADYDGRNPRTANRALPKGELSLSFAWLFTMVASAVLVHCGLAIEPAGAETFAGRARGFIFVFVHQEIHVVVAFRSGVLPGHVSGSGLDCDSGIARLAHADSVCRGDFVGGRIRRFVRLPGCGVRQIRGTVFHS